MADALSEAVAAVREATRDLPLSLARSSDVLLAGVQEAGDAAQALARGEAREPALWPLQDLVRQMEASASKADPLVNYHKALAEYAQGLLYPAATGADDVAPTPVWSWSTQRSSLWRPHPDASFRIQAMRRATCSFAGRARSSTWSRPSAKPGRGPARRPSYPGSRLFATSTRP